MKPELFNCIAVGFLLLQCSVMAVDKSKFKSCDQSAFCRRCRNYQPGTNDYELRLETMELKESELKIKLLSHKYGNELDLSLTALVDSTFRLTVNEMSIIKDRFVVKGALAKDPEQQKFQLISKNDDYIELIVPDNKATVRLLRKPFQIKFSYNGKESVIVNGENLMNFEFLRRKPDVIEKKINSEPQTAEDTDQSETPTEIDNEPGMWEENFQSFTDSKPYGPEAVALDFSFPEASHVYGIPEHADSMSLKATLPRDKSDPYRLYNLDVFEYEVNSKMAIYGAVPVVYAHGKEMTVGVFWHNAAETWVDIRKSDTDSSWQIKKTLSNLFSSKNDSKTNTNVHFMSEAGIIDAFIMLGPKPKDAMKQYTQLTGVAPLPQLWSLGYHQCRWNYKDQNDVLTVSKKFDEYKIPLDVIWLDIEYTDQKKYFTWDPREFHDPKAMINELKSRDRKLVIIIDPHIKRDADYFLHRTALENNYYVLDEHKNVYNGHCWPGDSSYLDFFKTDVFEYYSNLYLFDNFKTTTPEVHIWNDMNEPSVFSGPEITMPKTNLHNIGDKFIEHREVHNIYCLINVQATFLGLLKRSNYNQRPFILTRGHFAGSQRYTAVWTGDNNAEWSHLEISLPMCLSLAISGISFCGADVGGFFNNPDNELFTRWYQTGAWLPFFRAHSHIETPRREPYLKTKEYLEIVRAVLQQRYTYLPFWYLSFRQHELTGVPVLVPLFAEFPDDEKTFSIDDQFLVGGKIMVKPITKKGLTSTLVYFPGGPDEIWVDVIDGNIYPGIKSTEISAPLNKVPVFHRGGTIIPKKERIRRSTVAMKNDPYTLVVTVNSNNTAYGNLYSDDGESYDYKRGQFVYQSYKFESNRLTSETLNPSIKFDNSETIERIRVWNPPKAVKSAKIISDTEQITDVTYTKGGRELVIAIRKPQLKIQADWSIELLF